MASDSKGASEADLERADALLRSLLDKRTLIVVGPGGVGKTTTAAAVAVQAARFGYNVLVLTVDPAKRLASSLGLPELGNEEIRIDPGLFSEAGVTLAGGGALHAMMLDTKSTFDDLIQTYAPSPEVRDRILQNPFYEQASSAMAGSQEYMAMEKLYELREAREYDLIVLDTPPTRNALDFLSAADRIEDFLESGAIKVLMQNARRAGRLGLGLLRRTGLMLKGLNRFVGAETFLKLLEFIESFSDMYEGFKSRAKRVRQILRSDDVAFVIVSSTDHGALDEGIYFHDELRSHGMPFGAFLVNQVRRSYLEQKDLPGLAKHLVERSTKVSALRLHSRNTIERMAAGAAKACTDYDVLARVDDERIASLRKTLGDDAQLVRWVPLFDQDVHTVATLADFADVLFRTGEPADVCSV